MQSKDERQNGTIYERCFNAEQGWKIEWDHLRMLLKCRARIKDRVGSFTNVVKMQSKDQRESGTIYEH